MRPGAHAPKKRKITLKEENRLLKQRVDEYVFSTNFTLSTFEVFFPMFFDFKNSNIVFVTDWKRRTRV